eukprot:scaffold5_cov331-Pavlova_lutheri.AAC.27
MQTLRQEEILKETNPACSKVHGCACKLQHVAQKLWSACFDTLPRFFPPSFSCNACLNVASSSPYTLCTSLWGRSRTALGRGRDKHLATAVLHELPQVPPRPYHALHKREHEAPPSRLAG